MLTVFGGAVALALFVTLWIMTVLFAVALLRRDPSTATVGWPLAALGAAFAALWWWQPHHMRATLVIVLVAMWGVRLFLHLFMRAWGLRQTWRAPVLIVFARDFLLRAILLTAVLFPVLWVIQFPGPRLEPFDLIGVGVWLIGFLIEAIADGQLVRFRKHPGNNGKVMASGLWRYSRHPNYFGEALMWWGLWLIAVPAGGWWLTALGPLTAMFLVLMHAGLPAVDPVMMKRPAYRLYAGRTSRFMPWLPQKQKRKAAPKKK